MQLAPSLHRVGSDLVASYLVEESGSVTVIDAGLPGDWDALVSELAAMGRGIEDVRAILLTHGDTDHVGFAARLARERRVPVHVHELDAARAAGEVRKPMTGWGPVRARPLASFLVSTARRGGLRIPPVADTLPLEDGATLDLPGSPRIVHLPGHTPGSVAIHVPHVDALFVGDALTTRNVLTGEPGPRPAPFTLRPDDALASLVRLDAVEARWLLPGHGAPWTGGVGEALDQVRSRAAGMPSRTDRTAVSTGG